MEGKRQVKRVRSSRKEENERGERRGMVRRVLEKEREVERERSRCV